jgi:hypothetical protein
MAKLEQTDGFEPNKQTPRTTTKLGESTNLFSEVHATSGSFSNLTVNGNTLNKFTMSGTIDADGLAVNHNLGNAYPAVAVYDGGGSGVSLGSGNAQTTDGRVRVDSSGVNTVYLFAVVSVDPAWVTVIG